MALDGKVHGRRWRLELGRATRDFIRGKELRARAQLGLDEDIAVIVMNRALRDRWNRVYELSTDDLQISIDSKLPQEMRWLAMFEEMAWPSLPVEFWDRFSV